MVKARIIVDGTVQGTGYRALVKNYANRRGLNGIVRNLPDGKVEIFVEGTKEKIEQLTKDINVKGNPTNPLSLNVENITISWEGNEGFEEPWKTYSGFEIDYGAEKLTVFEKENLESLEWAKLRFSMLEEGIYSFRAETNHNFKNLNDNTNSFRAESKQSFKGLEGSINSFRVESDQNSKALNDNMNSFRTESNENFKALNNSLTSSRIEANQNSKALENGICSFRDDTKDNFSNMANKYDAISTDVKATKQELTTSLDKLPDRIGESLTKHLKKLIK